MLVRKVVGVAVKKVGQPWLRQHGFMPPTEFALWPGTLVWDFLRFKHDYLLHRCQWVTKVRRGPTWTMSATPSVGSVVGPNPVNQIKKIN